MILDGIRGVSRWQVYCICIKRVPSGNKPRVGEKTVRGDVGGKGSPVIAVG